SRVKWMTTVSTGRERGSALAQSKGSKSSVRRMTTSRECSHLTYVWGSGFSTRHVARSAELDFAGGGAPPPRQGRGGASTAVPHPASRRVPTPCAPGVAATGVALTLSPPNHIQIRNRALLGTRSPLRRHPVQQTLHGHAHRPAVGGA